MFRAADVVVLNKIDLAPYVAFEVERFYRHLAAVNPRAQLLRTSATRGDGMAEWYAWLEARATCGPTSRSG
jgi:hydrogenase nickel incorporation protein HypB